MVSKDCPRCGSRLQLVKQFPKRKLQIRRCINGDVQVQERYDEEERLGNRVRVAKTTEHKDAFHIKFGSAQK